MHKILKNLWMHSGFLSFDVNVNLNVCWIDTIVLCEVCKGSYLSAPQFYSPVKWGGGEKMGEVNGANSIMATYASNWALVSLKHFPNASLTEMDKESKIFSQKQINNI